MNVRQNNVIDENCPNEIPQLSLTCEVMEAKMQHQHEWTDNGMKWDRCGRQSDELSLQLDRQVENRGKVPAILIGFSW